MQKKQRIDKLLVDLNLCPSRERAQACIMAGLVFVGTKKVLKSSESYCKEEPIFIKEKDHPYVSRGGLKLQGALEDFQIEVKNLIAADIGASTGGFSDCLLQKGIQKIYAIDVGTNQLDWKIRQNPKVICKEKTHILDVSPRFFEDPIDLVTIDLSFISLRKIFPHLITLFTKASCQYLALIKPQFELSPSEIPKGGVIKDSTLHQKAIDLVLKTLESLNLKVINLKPSRLKGQEGNQEFFVYVQNKL